MSNLVSNIKVHHSLHLAVNFEGFLELAILIKQLVSEVKKMSRSEDTEGIFNMNRRYDILWSHNEKLEWHEIYLSLKFTSEYLKKYSVFRQLRRNDPNHGFWNSEILTQTVPRIVLRITKIEPMWLFHKDGMWNDPITCLEIELLCRPQITLMQISS